MPTLTYTFPIQRIDDENTIQLVMVFQQTFTTGSPSYTAAEKGLRVLEYDKLEMSYDLEDALLVPSKFSLTIGDPQGEFDEIFFGGNGTRGYQTDKQATCTIKVNGINKFIGQIIEDSIELDMATKTIKFDAAPKTDAINKRMVYDDTGTVALNPFGFTSSSYYSIVYILEQIFSLINPAISYPDSLEIIHDWQFKGQRDAGGAYVNDIVFTELQQLIDPLFFINQYGISNCGDVLKKFAVDWCCFTGLISYDKAFFKKLFHYNSNNLQTVNVYGWKKGYRYGLIDYVKLTTGIASVNEPYEEGVFTELEDRYLVKKTLPGFWVGPSNKDSNVKASLSRSDYFIFTVNGYYVTLFPVEGDRYSNNGSTFEVVGIIETNDSTSKIATKRVSGANDPLASGDLTRVTGVGDPTIAFSEWTDANGAYQIYQTRDPNILNNAFSDHGDIIAKFWFKYRGTLANCRVDKFIFKGINYDFLKDFNYQGYKFQPIGMTFYYSKGYTECEAIYLGEL